MTPGSDKNHSQSAPAPATEDASAPDKFVTEAHRPGARAKRDTLPRHEKAFYGLGNQSMLMVNQIIEYQVTQVLVFGLGMSPAWKGVMIMIFRLWDAFTDPLMGRFGCHGVAQPVALSPVIGSRSSSI